jgi:acyl-CoA dehydrogenase
VISETAFDDVRAREFRAEVRAFLDEHFTAGLRAEAEAQSGVFADPDLARRWQSILHRRGWAAPNWPKEHGGAAFTALERYIFDEECAEAGTPVLPGMGLSMCGPVLIRFGTAWQQEYFLPRLLSGEHYWCQGYSEPQAGSDLAALSCRARPDGDDYIVNGSKIWTTHAHAANWVFLLVRTADCPKAQRGITFLLCPLDTRGITIRPIVSISGEHEVNQLFFDDVRVPQKYRVGDENAGWSIAKYLLEFERGGGSRAARLRALLRRIRRIAAQESRDGVPLFAHADFRRRFVELEMAQLVLQATEWRLLTSLGAGQTGGGKSASLLKLRDSQLVQAAAALAMDALGEQSIVDRRSGAAPQPEELAAAGQRAWPTARYLNSRAATIYGGSSEIQRNILARALIGD